MWTTKFQVGLGLPKHQGWHNKILQVFSFYVLSFQHNISELTGGKTYKKEEEPQNAIKAKETSRKSTVLQTRSLMQPVEEVVQLLASDVSGKVAGMSPDWLPAGWTEHVKDNNGRKVKVFGYNEISSLVLVQL